MPTRCVKVGLRAGSMAEGVRLEAAFLDEGPDGPSLIYVMHADDFDRAGRVAAASDAEVDRFHRAFKARCWLERTPLRALLDIAVDGAPGDP